MSDSAPNKYVISLMDTCAKLAGTVEVEEHTFYSRGFGADRVVVDLGGNKGVFSQYMVDNFPCTVYAVEPTPELYKNFPRHERIHAFQYAIGANNDPITFYLSDVDVASSANKNLAESFGIKGQVTVDGITLPKFLEMNNITQVELLKIDIEGAEFDMFGTLSDAFLRDNVKQITVEFHDFLKNMYDSNLVVEIKQRLESLGFFTINASARVGNNSNILFVNKSCKIQPNERFGMTVMQNVCRALAARQMRKKNIRARKLIVL